MVFAVIVACEIGFWILLALGLAGRYLWHWGRLSTALLVSTALLDLVLLTAAVLDMRSGAPFDLRHGLAAAYLAYSIVFGHRTIKWADARFRHRFAGGPAPARPPKGGMARARYEWAFWLRIVLAYAIACGVLFGMEWLVSDVADTRGIREFMYGLARVPAIALIWPVSYTIWPRKVESEV
ncbi:hypothetical protein [Thermoactinospora rubra]|uniref:hypothetical protein n=1 Tax=Thermoactinospora rubra TaxID=1088767 RepID=UPI000A0FEEE5|nr:hypothetical protein [Thermoactinospora rubra]